MAAEEDEDDEDDVEDEVVTTKRALESGTCGCDSMSLGAKQSESGSIFTVGALFLPDGVKNQLKVDATDDLTALATRPNTLARGVGATAPTSSTDAASVATNKDGVAEAAAAAAAL